MQVEHFKLIDMEVWLNQVRSTTPNCGWQEKKKIWTIDMGVAQWATIIFFSPMKQLEGSEHFIVLYYFLTFFF